MEITELRTHLELKFDNEVQKMGVDQHFSVAHPNAFHMRKKFEHLKDWDGLIRFCKPLMKGSDIFKLPVGFKVRLVKFLTEESLKFSITEKDPTTAIPFGQHLHGVQLDPTQCLAAQALLAEHRAVLELGTASGKTEIALNNFLCLRQVYPNAKAAFIVPRKALAEQTIERSLLRAPGLGQPGMVGDGKFEIDAPLVVATAQTACGRDGLVRAEDIKNWLKTLDLLILDEAHHAAVSEQWQDILRQCGAHWVWAVSAKVTFWDPKNALKHMNLESLFGPPVYQGRSEERTSPVTVVFYHYNSWKNKFKDMDLYGSYLDMMPCTFRAEAGQPWENGFWRGPDAEGTVPEFCLMPNPKDVVGVDTEGKQVFKREALIQEGTEWVYNPDRRVPNNTTFGPYVEDPTIKAGWRKVEVATENIIYWNRHDVAIMEFKERNQWALDLCQTFAARNQAFAVSCRRKRHTKRIAAMLIKAGLKIVVCTDKMDSTEQNDVMKEVKEGRAHGVVANYSMISEGTDIPNLMHMVKLDGVSEEQVLNQQKGRLQRVFEGKSMGFLHIPRDNQHPALDKNCGHMVSYFRSLKDTKIKIKKLILA